MARRGAAVSRSCQNPFSIKDREEFEELPEVPL
jgi:hypothetical protein